MFWTKKFRFWRYTSLFNVGIEIIAIWLQYFAYSSSVNKYTCTHTHTHTHTHNVVRTFRKSDGSTSLLLLWKTFLKMSTIKTSLILLNIHIFSWIVVFFTAICLLLLFYISSVALFLHLSFYRLLVITWFYCYPLFHGTEWSVVCYVTFGTSCWICLWIH